MLDKLWDVSFKGQAVSRRTTAGTIPDGKAVSGTSADQLDGMPASFHAGPDIEPGPWDQFFDHQQDIRIEERGATFR